jgi:hypothetical protein
MSTYGAEDTGSIGDIHERFDPVNANPLLVLLK